MGLVTVLLAIVLIVDWLAGNALLKTRRALLYLAMLVFGVMGASVFSFGVMFSYLIAIFTDKPVRGMFGRVIFDPPLDYSFGWLGAVIATSGIVVSVIALVLLVQGLGLAQIWFWLLLGALLIVVGGRARDGVFGHSRFG